MRRRKKSFASSRSGWKRCSEATESGPGPDSVASLQRFQPLLEDAKLFFRLLIFGRIHLVPKLRLGTLFRETLFRETEFRSSPFPNRSLGTRGNRSLGTRGVWERGEFGNEGKLTSTSPLRRPSACRVRLKNSIHSFQSASSSAAKMSSGRRVKSISSNSTANW